MQKTFNTIVTHLRQQGDQSLDSFGIQCRYRNYLDKKCAIGCLISDEEYLPEMESLSLFDLQCQYPKLSLFSKECGDDGANYFNLLNKMQNIHDLYFPPEWELFFKEVAKEHKLSLPKKIKISGEVK